MQGFGVMTVQGEKREEGEVGKEVLETTSKTKVGKRGWKNGQNWLVELDSEGKVG